MKKKVWSMILALSLLISTLTGCGGMKESTADTQAAGGYAVYEEKAEEAPAEQAPEFYITESAETESYTDASAEEAVNVIFNSSPPL